MRKDGGGAAATATAAASSPVLVSCLDIKPFVATLVVITLLMAIWQLQPYESIVSTSSSSSICPSVATNAYNLIAPIHFTSSASNSSSSSSSSTTTTTISATTNVNMATTTFPASTSLFKSAAAITDPNKRIFHAYGNAAALFVKMGAYRGGAATFSVVGLASKPIHVFGKPWFKCEWIPNSPSSSTIRTKAYKILPDWGYGRVYTVVVVNCTFPVNPNADNSGGKLLLYAYYSPLPRKYEKLVVLEEAPGSFNESKFKPPFPYEYLYCGSSLYGNLSASRIREWMAYHAFFFGPRSHFVFHDAGGVSPEVMAALEPWVKAGRATIQDIRAQEEYDGYYYNQFLVVNDCLHRYRHAANWTFFFDVDEYIFLPEPNSTLESVLKELEHYTQFTIEQNAMSSKLCVLEPGHDYSRDWGFEKLLFRDSRTGIRRDRKYAIQAKNAYATGVHMSENIIGPTTHKTESKIRYYHYHNSINVMEEPCREFVPIPTQGNYTWFEQTPYEYDDSMKRVGETIRRFEEETVGKFRV